MEKIRCVVTGHDENGVATVIMDGEAASILQRPNRPGVTPTNSGKVTNHQRIWSAMTIRLPAH